MYVSKVGTKLAYVFRDKRGLSWPPISRIRKNLTRCLRFGEADNGAD